MADDEADYEAEEEQAEKKPKRGGGHHEEKEKELTETERALLATKKRHEEEDAIKMAEYEESRRIEREKLEEDLLILKEKQARRKQEREEEERIMLERKRAEDKRRAEEEEERKRKSEEAKRLRTEEKMRRLQMMAGQGIAREGEGGANFQIEKVERAEGAAPPKKKEGQTKEQAEEHKRRVLAELQRPLSTDGMDLPSLRSKIKEMHTRISKLEADKYDLEKRHERQEYDLKELAERQRQINRQKALKKGLDPEAMNSKFPPKMATASKYDRQIDRRSYADRKDLYQNPPKKKTPKVFHGSARPPNEWGRKDTEELENLRKNLEGPKYVEVVKVEGAKPPMSAIPSVMPELDPDDLPKPKAKVMVPEPDEAPAEEEAAAEEEE